MTNNLFQRCMSSRRLALCMISICISVMPFTSQAEITKHSDVVYANSGTRDLLLDLYLPEGVDNPPLIIWLHGGAWRAGTKDNVSILDIVDKGFALASIEFRNSGEAVFPAQMHDIKAAIRFLRGTAGEHGYDASAIVAWGVSSGAHLAALTGTTNGNPELEGTLGDHTGESSDVQAIVDYFGPTNLLTILHQSTQHGVNVRAPAMQGLLGKPVEDPAILELATLASPALQVSDKAPPLLIMHGAMDNQVPINQSIELQLAYEKAGRPVETHWVAPGTHGSGEYYVAPYLDHAVDFLRRVLQP